MTTTSRVLDLFRLPILTFDTGFIPCPRFLIELTVRFDKLLLLGDNWTAHRGVFDAVPAEKLTLDLRAFNLSNSTS